MNDDLSKTITENLQEIEQKHNSDAELNQQIMKKVNGELKSCQIKIEKSHFAFKCFN